MARTFDVSRTRLTCGAPRPGLRDGKWIAVAANDGTGTYVYKVPVNGGIPGSPDRYCLLQPAVVSGWPIHCLFRTASRIDIRDEGDHA